MYRNIRWIYYADCTQCLSDDFKVSQLIHGGELVIVTNAALTDNDDKMLSMIVKMNQKNIAGLVINVGQISPMLTEYCNDNELPLFELSYDLHLIDLSQIVCKALVEEESNTNSIDQLLAAIIYSSNINDADIKIRAGYLGTSISDKNHIVVLKLNKNNKLQTLMKICKDISDMNLKTMVCKKC
ncbi:MULTISPECIES: PucR family transcriptional regulator ligand-binding domain-containing protein [Ruminococcus]|nr:PucR family transcriptional regulator ligand-binding domain-containing protein [Ruminococcus sp.]